MTLPRDIARALGALADRGLLAIATLFQRAGASIAASIRRRREARHG